VLSEDFERGLCPLGKRRRTTATTKCSRVNPIDHYLFLNILNMRSVSRNPPIQLKEAVTIAIMASTAIRGGRLLKSRIRAPRIAIEEMALVVLIKGVCSNTGTLETRNYPS
jgi:hypothetical protein